MEFATKYALIPEDDFSKHVPSKQQMTDFDIAMSKILNSSLPDHEKIQRYYELLKRKMDLQEFNIPWLSKQPEEEKNKPPTEKSIKQESPVKQEPQQDYDSLIISSVPAPMKTQAENLLNFLKKHPNIIQWDQRGRITHHGRKLEQSNVAELFHLIFCVNKKASVPAQNEFLQALQEIGIPSSIIKNKHLNAHPKTVNPLHGKSPRRKFVKSKKRLNVQKGGSWESY